MVAAVPFRRELLRPWFRIVARLGGKGGEETFLDPDPKDGSIEEVITATRDGVVPVCERRGAARARPLRVFLRQQYWHGRSHNHASEDMFRLRTAQALTILPWGTTECRACALAALPPERRAAREPLSRLVSGEVDRSYSRRNTIEANQPVASDIMTVKMPYRSPYSRAAVTTNRSKPTLRISKAEVVRVIRAPSANSMTSTE